MVNFGVEFSAAFWIILTGALVAGSGGLLGCFLILRRLAMLGDAISHAVLPGIVLAFMISQSRAPFYMFIGAVIIGILTTFLVQFLSNGGVHRDAAMGVTFTSLFALGVVGVSMVGSQFDLDTECVLFGEIAFTPLDVWFVNGRSWGPRAVWINGGIFLLNLFVILLLYKEFKICAFDAEMAAAVGISITAMHYLLMSLVALTTVAAFESVGVILIVALLIVPAATAYLLTERLHIMMIYAMGIGALSSISGYFIAARLDSSIAGAMASMAGAFFALAFLFSPTHGIVSRWLVQRSLRQRVAEEDALLWMGRQNEVFAPVGFRARELSESQNWLMPKAITTLQRLLRKGFMVRVNENYSLTKDGDDRAKDLLKRHRLYESYLDELGYSTDHLHDPADRVEHHITPQIVKEIDQETNQPLYDPQGKQIPRE